MNGNHFRLLKADIQTELENLRRLKKVLDNAVMIQQDMFADLRRGTGAVVISSWAGGEYSLESAEWQGGVFTHAVIEGLSQRKANNN